MSKNSTKIDAPSRNICPICVNGVIRISINISVGNCSKVEMLCGVEIDRFATMNNAVPLILILIHWHLLVRALPMQPPPPPASNAQNKSITHRTQEMPPQLHSVEDDREFCGRIYLPVVERRGNLFQKSVIY